MFKGYSSIFLPTGHWDGGKQAALEELGMGIVSAAAVQKD
jgi:hypothetical protein